MHLAITLLWIPLAAASGEVESPESPSSGGVGVGIVSAATIALGWITLFALWWFVFRDKERSRRRRRKQPSDDDGAADGAPHRPDGPPAERRP